MSKWYDDEGVKEPTGGDPRFLQIIEDIKLLHMDKSHDYGTDEDIYANVRASEGWGIPAWEGAMVRACDKVARLQTYAKKGELANESVRDSFLDLASYAIIAAVLFEQDVEARGEDNIRQGSSI